MYTFSKLPGVYRSVRKSDGQDDAANRKRIQDARPRANRLDTALRQDCRQEGRGRYAGAGGKVEVWVRGSPDSYISSNHTIRTCQIGRQFFT